MRGLGFKALGLGLGGYRKGFPILGMAGAKRILKGQGFLALATKTQNP